MSKMAANSNEDAYVKHTHPSHLQTTSNQLTELRLYNASPPSLDLQAALDAELAMEAAYKRKLAALTELKVRPQGTFKAYRLQLT
jgi:hypothetical protein